MAKGALKSNDQR